MAHFLKKYMIASTTNTFDLFKSNRSYKTLYDRRVVLIRTLFYNSRVVIYDCKISHSIKEQQSLLQICIGAERFW